MGDIRIRVGVALDSNVRTVYQPLVAAAQQAAQNVMRALNTGAKITIEQQARTFAQAVPAIGHPYREGAKQAGAAMTSLREKAKREADAMEKDVARSAKNRVREERAALREIERDLDEHNRRVTAKLEKEESIRDRLRDRFARRFSHGAVHNGAAAVGMARRLAGDIAHGAGVETNVGTMVHDYTHRQELATALSTEGHIGAWGHPDTAINGSQERMDPKLIMQRANDIALKTGTEGGAAKIMEGMQSFLMKTGNLRQAVDMMEDLAVFSKATSTSMDDTLEAVGALSNQLPKTMSEAEKMDSIKATMRVLGGQGEVGALHVRQLARGGGMEKLAGVANQFTLDKSTSATLDGVGLHDKISQNVAVMGAMAQMAMKRGGRGNATGALAINSSKAFIEDLQNKATAKQWAAAFGAGEVYSDASHTTLKDPKQLILAALSKTHGSGDAIGKLMPNKVSKAVITGFAAEYNDAVRGAKEKDPSLSKDALNKIGLDAVNKEFDRFLHVTIDGTQLQEKFQEQMTTTSSKVAQLNVKLQMLADSTAEKILPGMLALAPQVEKAAGAFSDFILWATEHPGKAIGAAISASIAQAAIGQAVRTTIEKAIHAGSGGAFGKLAAPLTIVASAVTVAELGMMAIDHVAKIDAKADSDRATGAMHSSADATVALSRKTVTPEDEARFRSELAAHKKEKERLAGGPQYTFKENFAADMLRWGSLVSSGARDTRDKYIQDLQTNYATNVKNTNDAIWRLTQTLEGIQKGTIKVVVQNNPPTPDGSSHPIAAPVGGGH